jgi:hypothetical protein
MANDDTPATKASAPVEPAQDAQTTATGATELVTRRPLPATRMLTRSDLEALRSRLQRKFH